jgi:hypothetical protein
VTLREAPLSVLRQIRSAMILHGGEPVHELGFDPPIPTLRAVQAEILRRLRRLRERRRTA